MAGVDTRNVARDSLFMLADITLESNSRKYRVKVRNLSPRGMMGEGDLPIARGSRLTIDFRDAGEATGSVAWIEGARFGIAFEEEIDMDAVRNSMRSKAPQSLDVPAPRYSQGSYYKSVDRSKVRTV
ncbi:PilZ domain-containing protein [Qipengyuania atrilutea]|uniref:PilZ domain-containing protein n=1 Tax=Qipengyuania atrilutea TaxID=2744473 RepID=A0A850H1W2_9SPHN|nr:PilZ domain-containing protein [Actirhodobacter atriluteus]NVD44676.1 PilZ domain-containing protein [Actirhodobacter atriluteus]